MLSESTVINYSFITELMKKTLLSSIDHVQISLALLLLRLGTGAFMLTHGWPKMMKLLGDGEISFADPLGIGQVPSLILAAFAELIGSILLIVGAGTRIAAFLILFTMSVAVFIVHADDPFARKELGLLYLVNALVLMVSGGGRFAVDFWLLNRKQH
jgi:putative oxidoreductase